MLPPAHVVARSRSLTIIPGQCPWRKYTAHNSSEVTSAAAHCGHSMRCWPRSVLTPAGLVVVHEAVRQKTSRDRISGRLRTCLRQAHLVIELDIHTYHSPAHSPYRWRARAMI